MKSTTINRAVRILGSIWIYSFLSVPGVGLLSKFWQPAGFDTDTVLFALVIVSVLAGLGALLLSYPQSRLPGTKCLRCGEIRRAGPGGLGGEVFGVCSCR
jgi:hypothetical protein